MTDYGQLAENSKVWVFQAEREFSQPEAETLTQELTQFTDNWLSHGSLLKACFKLVYNRFIVFFVDEEGDNMCGRAIDASVRFIKELETKYGVAMLNRNLVAYMDNGKAVSCTLEQLSHLAEEGKITVGKETLAYLNRLSSLLYALARQVNYKSGITEEPPTYN